MPPHNKPRGGLWGPYDLPSPPQYRLLEHLAQEGEPRLFVEHDENGFVLRASATNSARSAFNTYSSTQQVRCDLADFFRGAGPSGYRPWVAIDEVATKKHGRQIFKAYRLTDDGREAMAQYIASGRFKKAAPRLAARILSVCRKATAGTRPKQ